MVIVAQNGQISYNLVLWYMQRIDLLGCAVIKPIIINYYSLEMSHAQIYSKIIKEYLINNAKDHNQLNPSNSKQSLLHLSGELPHLAPQQIRNICKAQEQNIIQKVLTLQQYDLYSQVSRLCPNEKDLRHISAQEVTNRLNCYNSKLLLAHRSTCESESQSEEESWEQNKSQVYFGSVNFNLCQTENQIRLEPNTMRNIFEECDNQNCENIQYFGLS